jgi:hypothetical protein
MANQTTGQALSDSPALKPYRGKPAVRNFRGGDGNVGIIRSPVRAIALPDYRKGAANPSWPRVLQAVSRDHARSVDRGKNHNALWVTSCSVSTPSYGTSKVSAFHVPGRVTFMAKRVRF